MSIFCLIHKTKTQLISYKVTEFYHIILTNEIISHFFSRNIILYS